MKRYLLFAGDVYYSSGGWTNFVADFNVLQSALSAGAWIDAAPDSNPFKNGVPPFISAQQAKNFSGMLEWWHIVDSQTGRIVACNQAAQGHGCSFQDPDCPHGGG